MKSVVKTVPVLVYVTADENDALRRLAKVETQRRHATVGKATLLREYAMPIVRRRLAHAEKAVAA